MEYMSSLKYRMIWKNKRCCVHVLAEGGDLQIYRVGHRREQSDFEYDEQTMKNESS